MESQMIIAIDPSLNNTGYAIYQDSRLIQSGVIRPQGKEELPKLRNLAHILKTILGHGGLPQQIRSAIVEYPANFTYSKVKSGQKSLNIKDMYKLNRATGVIISVLNQWGILIETIEANKWKAGRAKGIDKAVAGNIASWEIKNDNEADAIVLGQWFLERNSG